MIKKILIGLAVVLVALCGVIATRPSEYTVQRSATFKASPDIAFAQVNDFHRWSAWSPWDKLDPNQKVTFDGAATGVGARYGWSGDDKVGEGRMTIEESKPSELVRIKLEFIRPFADTSTTLFTFSPVAEGVSVTWKMEGHNNFVGKAMCMVVDMDAMLGKDFEKGLADLKTVAESETQKQAEAARLAAEAAAAQQAAPAEGQPTPPSSPAIAVPTP